MKKIYSLALVLLLSSCSSVPTEQEGAWWIECRLRRLMRII